jgi:hypothetical protein
MAVAAPAITFALPAQLAVGADPAEFSGTVINDTGSDYAAVRYDITIDGPPDLVAADLLVEYDSDGAGTFLPLTLTDDAGVITTFFGPAGGFPLPDGASFLTDFRVTVLTGAPTGAVTVTVDLVVIDEGPVEPPIVTLVNESEIVAAPGVSVTTPAMLVRGAAPSGGNVTISPPAVGDYSGVNLEIRFTGASALDVGDVGVAYVDPNATGTPLTSLELTEDGDDLVGTIPNSGTINLPDQSGDYDFIISATSGAPLGTLTMTATFLRGAEELGQASDTSEIVEVDPTTTTVALTVAPNPANPGQPVTLTATVDAVADVAPPPTGTVHFRVYGTEVGSAAIDANGVATLVLGSGLPLGTYLVTADFDANPPFTDSTSNVVTFTEQLPTRLGRFIDSVYLGVLQRHVDPAGLSYWTDQINRTGDRNTFTFAMLFSDEVRARNCTNFYQYYLGRTPDTPGLLYCIGLLQQGLHLDDVETTITGSAEYLGLAGGTNNGFLDRLYAQVLGRPIDPAARAFYLQALADGAPRAFVSATVLQSDERSGIFVESAYQTILGRVSDPLGKAYWVGQLANRVREEALIGLLYGSDEYFNKIS